MKELIKQTLKNVGLQIRRYPDGDLKNRQLLLKHFQVNKVLDVGANTGQYAMLLRELGYAGKIISFEPLSSAFDILERRAEQDEMWIAKNIALGDEDKESTINIAGNSTSSSILDMLPAHLDGAPKSKYIGQETIKVNKLDTIFKDICKPTENVLLKIDTQGFERNVLDGADSSLKHISVIQIEMSLVPLYKNAMLFLDTIEFLKRRKFDLFTLENGFTNTQTGQLLQVDGVFYNRALR